MLSYYHLRLVEAMENDKLIMQAYSILLISVNFILNGSWVRINKIE